MSRMPDRPDRQVSRPATEQSGELPDRAALERVLRETLNKTDPMASEDAVRIEALVGLARRHRGEPLRLEPVARQLIGLLLRTQFPNLKAPEAFWDQVSTEIAATLMEDPQQEALLHRFWNRLCDKAA